MATDFLVKQGRVMGGVRLVTDADVAHQTDLTNIRETGTTSSQAISAETYFYLNGTLVRAKVDIASGATFTLNTNYEVVTAGALNELKDRIVYDETSVYNGSASSAVSAGARFGSVSVNIAKNGYTPISVTLVNCGAQGSAIYTLDLKSNTSCEANIYAATAGTPTYSFKVRTAYVKST